MTDIDHFKKFNDQHGHLVGDEVIIAVAKALGSELRSFDLLCRYGGEEFCILLPNSTPRQALDIAERLRRQIEEVAGRSIRTTEGLKITASFGVASLRDEADDLNGLIDQADEALYFSKQNGRNRVSLWKPAEDHRMGNSKKIAAH
jgi:diguanylate cyclase (GGDEF)-like protein